MQGCIGLTADKGVEKGQKKEGPPSSSVALAVRVVKKEVSFVIGNQFFH